MVQMERFGYPSSKTSSYSDGGDRYGFDHSPWSSISTDDFSVEKKPHFKITVSSTGKVEEKVLPPIVEKRRPPITSRENESRLASDMSSDFLSRYQREEKIVISIKDLEKAFASSWMEDYKHLGESLLRALREESFPVKKPIQPLASGYLRCQPYFVNCQPDPRSTTTFNGHNIHISIFLTEENRIKKSTEIFPFGDSLCNIPHCPITFAIHEPSDSDFLGKAHGNIISYQGYTMIRITRIEDFAKTKITWEDIPAGSNLISTLSIEGSIPLSIEGHIKGSIEEESLPNDTTGQLPIIGEIIVPKPYFGNHEASSKNQFSLDGNHVEAYLEIVTKPPPSFFLPIKGQEKKFLLNVVGKEEQIIAYLEGCLDAEGKVDLGQLLSPEDQTKHLKWEDVSPVGLQVVVDLDPDQDLSL